MIVDAVCHKCGTTFALDIKDNTIEQTYELLGKQQGFQCPGRHVELDSPRNYWTLQVETLREGGAPSEEKWLENLRERHPVLYTPADLREQFVIEGFAYGAAYGHRKTEPDKQVTLDFAHSPGGRRFYWVI